MDNQLVLLESSRDWKLDRRTVERGRRGIARARAALRASQPDEAADRTDEGQAA